jgi:hypothetical protein
LSSVCYLKKLKIHRTTCASVVVYGYKIWDSCPKERTCASERDAEKSGSKKERNGGKCTIKFLIILLLTNYYCGSKRKNDAMNAICSTNGKKRIVHRFQFKKSVVKRLFSKH